MNILFKKENLKTTIFTIIYLIFGLLFCIMPTKMFNFAESILCGGLLVVGFVCIVIYALMPGDIRMFKLLIYGIFALVLGLFMLMLAKFFGIILSVIIGASGVNMIIDAVKEKKLGTKTWITDLVIGIVVTALAVVTIVLSGTNVIKNMIAVFFGIMMLIEGIYDLVQLILILKEENERKKHTIDIVDFEVKNATGGEANQSDVKEIAQSNDNLNDKPKD